MAKYWDGTEMTNGDREPVEEDFKNYVYCRCETHGSVSPRIVDQYGRILCGCMFSFDKGVCRTPVALYTKESFDKMTSERDRGYRMDILKMNLGAAGFILVCVVVAALIVFLVFQ